MRKTTIHIAALSAAACLLLSGCYKEEEGVRYDSVGISLYPAAFLFNADGTTENGDECYLGTVTVRKGTAKTDMGWTFSDPDKGWVTVERAKMVSQYTGIDGKSNYDLTEDGIQITLGTNNSYRRSFDIVIRAEDGTEKTFTFTQLGSKADATVEASVSAIDIPCVGGESEIIEYTTNMDRYSYSISYDGTEKDWLTVVDKGLGKVAVKASAWSSETSDRTATLTIKTGSEATSTASCDVKVTQLKFDTYYYAYGPSLGLERQSSAAMTKKDKGVYVLKAFLFDAGTNAVCFNKDTRSESYPVYYLAADGSIKASASAVTSTDLKVPANGIYTITADFNAMTWTMERSVKCLNCMPDSELARYPVKAYPTAAGGEKTWMTVSLHWNGGPSMGMYKLGSGLVGGHQTGGYGTPSDKTVPYESRNSAYDTEENGGSVKELYCEDGVTPLSERFGRLYAAGEYLLGLPSGCLNDAYQMDCPYGVPGDIYTDDAGLEMQLENIVIADLSAYEGTAEGDAKAEKEHPSLKMQIQGICPFGWHVANMQDWKDLIYAASKASAGTDKEVPAANASYKAIAGGTITNFASLLYAKEWFDWTGGHVENRSSAADAFGWGMFVQGWRLFATGYDYGATDDAPRFYAAIPLMGQYTTKKKAFWRAYVTGEGCNITMNDGCDIGNGCGTAVRCVKNYKTE